ncbi:MAG: 30S ribosomal protein S17 [Mycoplasma sp.]|jgi:small subunit ribosomal protein S17|nr:30S ribosomal protein S17 [Mycoplasma sp.]MBQ6280241.1 30S ribosomal protein S17 [Mycoplasma sp.]
MEQKKTKVERTSRKTFRGVVVSTKMNKTVTVDVQRKFLHPLYRKQVISDKKYHAADPKSICGVGDVVRIIETRPISKTVCYRVESVIRKAK